MSLRSPLEDENPPTPYSAYACPMSKPPRSRPIDFCLEENSDRLGHSNRRAEIHQLPSSKQVGVTFYSGVRSLQGLLIGQGCADSHSQVFGPPPFSKAVEPQAMDEEEYSPHKRRAKRGFRKNFPVCDLRASAVKFRIFLHQEFAKPGELVCMVLRRARQFRKLHLFRRSFPCTREFRCRNHSGQTGYPLSRI